MKRSFTAESGQAFMELTIMLLILTAMILAIVLLSGLEISSNATLLSARKNTFNASMVKNAVTTHHVNELSSWFYPVVDLKKSYIHPERQGSFGGSRKLYKNMRLYASGDGTLRIPFSYQGTSGSNSSTQTLSYAEDAITSARYTNNNLSYNITNILLNREQYKDREWRKLSNFDSSLQHDFSDSTGINAFNAAGLVSETGNPPANPTVNAVHQAGQHSSANAANIMYKSFKDLFGIDLTAQCLCENETNKVYIPVH